MINLWVQVLFLVLDSFLSEYPVQKIIGGWHADIRQVPYFVRILMGQEYLQQQNICGATIIHRRWLLTAGHCALIYPKMWLVLGVDNLSDTQNMPRNGDSLPRVDLIQCHPEYKLNIVRNKEPRFSTYWASDDICLVRVDHDIQFGRYINRAILPWQAYEQEFKEKQFIVSGYGAAREPELPNTLRSTNIKSLPHEICESHFNTYNIAKYKRDFHFCFGSPGNVTQIPCYGDSGGGILYKDSITRCNVVIGIVSMGYCVFQAAVRVPAYKEWVQETMDRFTFSEPGYNRHNYSYPQRNSLDDDE